MAKSEENLKAAFAGESQANRTYLAFAKAAEEKKTTAKNHRFFSFNQEFPQQKNPQ